MFLLVYIMYILYWVNLHQCFVFYFN